VGPKHSVEPFASERSIRNGELTLIVSVELGDGDVESIASKIDPAAPPRERAVDRRWRGRRLHDGGIVGNEAARSGLESDAMTLGAIGPDLNLTLGDQHVRTARAAPHRKSRPDRANARAARRDDKGSLPVLGDLKPGFALFDPHMASGIL